MDRYETFNDYAAAKHRIFMNQTAEDTAVLNADDPTVSSWASSLRANVMQFSVKKELDNSVFLHGRELIYRGQVLLNVDEMKLRGMHNVENVAAAFVAGIAAGASIESWIAVAAKPPNAAAAVKARRVLLGLGTERIVGLVLHLLWKQPGISRVKRHGRDRPAIKCAGRGARQTGRLRMSFRRLA